MAKDLRESLKLSANKVNTWMQVFFWVLLGMQMWTQNENVNAEHTDSTIISSQVMLLYIYKSTMTF